MEYDVIIIDDDKMVLFIQEKMLQMSGFSSTPLKFEDASKALDYFKSNTNTKDVIIFLDINMPYISGWEFLDELEENQPKQNIYVIVVTSSIDLRDKESAFEYDSVVDYMVKPVTKENLVQLKSNKNLKHLFEN